MSPESRKPPIELDRARVKTLLGQLDARLKARGVAGGVYLVGGAAIALTIPDRRVTHDIDVWASDQAVLDEAHALAVEEGMPTGWLNEQARGWIPTRVARPGTGPDARPGLAVEVAPPEHLLAMKMVAMRVTDVPDVVALAAHLHMSDAAPEDFARLLHDAYDGEDQLQDMLNVPHESVEEEALLIGRAVRRNIDAARARNAATHGQPGTLGVRKPAPPAHAPSRGKTTSESNNGSFRAHQRPEADGVDLGLD